MANHTSCPESILASIPWYPSALTSDERGAVESHAADCRSCRAELAFLSGEEEPAIELPDAEHLYARVLERIDALETGLPPSGEDLEERRARLGLLARARRIRRRIVQPVGVAAGLLVAVMSGMLTVGVIWVAREAPRYESAAGLVPGSGAELQIVFRPDATAAEIQEDLQRVGAVIVSGPTPRGVYGARLAEETDLDAAKQALRKEGRGVATFAESPLR